MPNRRLILTKDTGTATDVVAGSQTLVGGAGSPWPHLSIELRNCPPYENPEVVSNVHIIAIKFDDELCTSEWHSRGRWHQRIFRQFDSVLSPAGEIDKWRSAQHHDAVFLFIDPMLVVQQAEACSIRSSIEAPPIGFHDEFMRTCVFALLAEVKNGFEAPPIYGESIGTSLIVHLLTKYGSTSAEFSPPRGGLPKATLSLVLDYIAENYNQPISLDELAALANLSRYHFTRLFARSMSMSPYQYVIRYRLERAKSMMHSGDRSLKEIAKATGFHDASHLARLLRAYDSR